MVQSFACTEVEWCLAFMVHIPSAGLKVVRIDRIYGTWAPKP